MGEKAVVQAGLIVCWWICSVSFVYPPSEKLKRASTWARAQPAVRIDDSATSWTIRPGRPGDGHPEACAWTGWEPQPDLASDRRNRLESKAAAAQEPARTRGSTRRQAAIAARRSPQPDRQRVQLPASERAKAINALVGPVEVPTALFNTLAETVIATRAGRSGRHAARPSTRR